MADKIPSEPTPPPVAIARGKESTTDFVKEQILGWIESGELTPGAALPSERALQTAFGVSRVSVREAMVSLRAVGLIEIEHGRGCFVSSRLSEVVRKPFAVWVSVFRDGIVNLLKVRASLDGLVAFEAAVNRDEVAFGDIARAHDEFNSAVERNGGAAELAMLDKRFHLAIAKSSGLSVAENLLTELDSHVANSHRVTMSMSARPRQSTVEHTKIVDAIGAGDAIEARRAADAHVRSAIELIEDYDRHLDLTPAVEASAKPSNPPQVDNAIQLIS